MTAIFAPFADVSLLCLRLMIAVVFAASGYAHLKNPAARSASIEMSKAFTILLGAAELAAAVALATGVLARWAALGLILLMLGAIYKKAFVWKTGFWGKGSQGWHYDLIFIAMNLVVLCVGPGKLALLWLR